MNEDTPFNPREVTDEDIRRVSRLLGLPESAFHGENDDDPRLDVLKCIDNVDVEACPGSGKTTLLVAKLAILGDKWEHRTRGICVLSHTNAARREIEERLGCTAVGRQLLSYPHYIGTIHRFVDTFLALPWLRSRDFPIKMIDTGVCEMRRWRKIPYNLQYPLQKRGIDESGIRIVDSDFRWSTKTGACPFAETTNTYRAVVRACESTAREGFHCYDDMFIWASDLVEKVPQVSSVLRQRFPILLIDEAQDNSEAQSALLHRIFMDGEGEVRRQRFGDSNQAIYNFVGAKGASTDAFPCDDYKTSVPNSHRFGRTIAKLAEPLGLVAHDGGLTGNGPRPICRGSYITEGRHTIFCFADDALDMVLPAFADLLIATFTEDELNQGTFTAVGQIHNPIKDENLPRHVGHYWPEYDAELTKTDPQPKTFVQYIRAGQAEADARGETAPAIDKIAQGILRLAGMAEDGQVLHRRKRSHRYMLEMLDDHPDTRGSYTLLLGRFGVKGRVLSEWSWNIRWSKVVQKIGERIAAGSLSNADADAFLRWEDALGASTVNAEKAPRDNIYRYPKDDPKVHIKIGSVHSVKGQTHTATLVLETFWQDRQGRHNLELLLPWLDGHRRGEPSNGVHQKSRLKLHYVAMTRPTHLVCLAMKRSTFENDDGELDAPVVQALEKHGWQVKQL